MDAKTSSVETITDTSGAPAETQNSFGLFMLCMARIWINSSQLLICQRKICYIPVLECNYRTLFITTPSIYCHIGLNYILKMRF